MITYKFARRVRADLDAYHLLNDRLVLTLSENVQGVHVVKGFARQDEQIALFDRRNDDVRDRQDRIFRLYSRFSPTAGLLTQLNTAIVLALGGWLVLRNEADPTHRAGIALGSGLLVFAWLTAQFSSQIQQLASLSHRAQESLAAARRVFEILDAPVRIRSRADARTLDPVRGGVRFEEVSFSYRPQTAVLDRISFTVEPGTCVAILGPTGAGKSTLLSLIPRFYDPTDGRILLDGLDLQRLDLDDLRRNIGVVFQESFLFSNTIRANIGFGHPEATPRQVERAARIACAHDFISAQPDGYDTQIGERGADLSGGQRQRLAIARAVLLEPAILLLDDPTAAIDPDTEHEILGAMDNAMRDRTTFVVAHRLSTLRRAGLVLVLDGGRIAQAGTHDQLISADGYYRDMAELQVADPESRRLLDVGGGI